MRLFCVFAAILAQLSILNAQPTTNCVQCPPGLIAWWPGDGTADGLVGTNHGTLFNGASNTVGIVDEAFSFDGVNDYFAAPDLPLYSPHVGPAGELTVMAWVLARNLPASNGPFVAKGNTGAWEYAIYLNANGSVQLHFWTLSGTPYTSTTAGGTVIPGKWQHVAGTLKKGQLARIYLDGQQVGQASSFTGDTGDGTSPFWIGRRGDGYYFPGLVDEVALFNRALESNEIAAIHAAGTNGMCKDALPPTILSWPTNQFVALGSNVTLTVTASGTEPLSYQWLNNGTNIMGATDNSFTMLDAQTSASGEYSVVVSNAYGVAVTPAASVVVFPIPVKSPVFITTDATISAAETNYTENTLIVIGGSISIEGTHHFEALWVTNATTTIPLGSSLTCNQLGLLPGATMYLNGKASCMEAFIRTNAVIRPSAQSTGLDLSVMGGMVIDVGGAIDANGMGYSRAQGPGAGLSADHGGGGGHAGLGGAGSPGTGGHAYGSLLEPDTLGSGGGNGYYGVGGAGGGLVKLTVGGPLQLYGRISADGLNGSGYDPSGPGRAYGGGGGAGGTVLVTLGSIIGTGSISADGGIGAYGAGGGGGGRIALYTGTNMFLGSISSRGGAGGQRGGAGTVFMKPAHQTEGILTVDNGGGFGALTPIPLAGTNTLGGMSLRQGATVSVAADTVLELTAATLVLEEMGKLIVFGQVVGTASSQGRLEQLHVSPGSTLQVENGGQISTSEVLIDTNAIVLVNHGGNLKCESLEVRSQGELVLDASELTASNLTIGSQARLTLTNDALLNLAQSSIVLNAGGQMVVRGQVLRSGTATGEFDRMEIQEGSSLTLENGGLLHCLQMTVASNAVVKVEQDSNLAGGQTEILPGATLYLNHRATFGNFHVHTNGVVLPTSGRAGFDLQVTGDLTLDAGGKLLADGLGYGSDAGPGAGASIYAGQSSSGGGGAGHGGAGGNGNGGSGGAAYDSLTTPSEMGSGGGHAKCWSGTTSYPIEWGGAGGGVIRVTVGNRFLLNGSVTANGLNGETGYTTAWSGAWSGGGGSGGSIMITASSIEGGGIISAKGGNGGYTSGGGGAGGGAGGRIAFYCPNSSHQGVISVSGGAGLQPGEPGTVHTTPRVLPSPESFELGWGGWWQDHLLWSVRPPGNGPLNAYAGDYVVCGNLGDNYPAGSSSRLISPSFLVPAVNPGDLLVFRFWQWYQYGTGDSGLLQISLGGGTEWFPWETIAIAAPTNSSSGTWQQFVADLTPYQGQHVRLGFLHTANSDGSVGAGWYIDEVELSGFIPNPMLLGQDVTGMFNTVGDRAFYVVNAPPGGHLMLNLTGPPGSRVEIYVRRGALPSAGACDYRLTNPGESNQLFVPDAQAGPWYVMVYVDGLPAPGQYTLRTDFYEGIFLTGLTPTRHGNSNIAVVEIQGAGFDSSAWAWLVNGGTTVPATNVSFVSASRLVADFDIRTTPADFYQLTVAQGNNSAALPFEVTQGLGPKLETKLVVPSRVGYHTLATLWVEFKNTGDAAMPAPLLEVGGTQNGRSGAWLTLTEHRLVEGFWTSATPEGFANSVQFLASGATPALLQPGESGRVPVYYAGWQKPWDFGYPPIYFNLGILDANNTNFVDWVALKDDMRPSSLTAEQWEPVFWNLVAQTGPTWGDYVRMLNDNAQYLHRLGQRVTDIRDLLGFEVMQASGLSVTRTVASAVDAQVQTPGLPLTFTRSFSTDIPSHFTLGRLGRGWSDNWDRSLSKAADGTVTILGPGGSRRVFKPDSRTAGRYFAPAGDASVLTPIGGGAYTLRESDATIYTFHSDGKLNYVADTHGNHVSCTYSGNALVRLTHSAGPYLDLAYSGSRLASVTDSLGRWTAFTYAGTGEHLQMATDYRGHTTTYAYDLSGLTSAATRHALTNIFNADGSESRYEYDTFGRLTKKAGCCGSPECTYYSYDSIGRITATDALTNSTKYCFDHRGLLVRTENPLGGIVHRTFDLNGRLMKTTDAVGRSRTFTYDPRGNLSSETDALGYPTRYTYTADFNRLASVLDAKGNLTRYAYHPDGALASIIYPDGSREDWTYDSQGNRVSWTNRRRQTIWYTNDVLGRVIARAYPDGVVHNFNYDAQGNLISYTDPLGATTQEFDADGRLAKITYPGDRWLGYTYNTAGRRALMTNEQGHETRYFYDSAGRLERLTDERGSNIVVYAYDAAGRMALKTLGNGIYTTYAYDPAGQLLDLFNRKSAGSVLSRFQYTYDSRGRRDTMTTTYGDGDPRTDLAGLWRYDYDDTGQLVGWTAPWGRRVDYTYDALGNRLNVCDNGTNTAYTVNNLNQYTQVGSTTYRYDADGNLTNRVRLDQTSSYEWSTESRLVQITEHDRLLRQFYDAVGNLKRWSESGATRDLVYDPSELGNMVSEYGEGESYPKSRHHYGIDLVSRRDSSGGDVFFTFDARGSSTELTRDSDGAINPQMYLPFGERVIESHMAANVFEFNGEQGVISEIGDYYHMRARHYIPSIARFMSVDPLGVRAESKTLYEYAANSPTMHTDPLGLKTVGQVGCLEKYRGRVLYYWIDPGLTGRDRECVIVHENIHVDQCESGRWWLTKVLWGEEIGTLRLEKEAYDAQKKCMKGEYPYREPQVPKCDTNKGCVLRNDPIPPSSSGDPNELEGPNGYGAFNFISVDSLLPYTIHFENETNATAPAQRVMLSNQLTNLLDWTTFELTEIAFGDQFIAVPPQTKRFETSVQLSVDGYQFVVQIEAGIRLDTGEVYARFQSLNPTSGLPPPVDIGMLPPENGTGRGQGHVSYVIRPNVGLATGTEIRNVACIVFDQNPPIGTDWVDPHDPGQGIDTNKQALVTIDADPPSSAIQALPTEAPSASFTMCWTGSDLGAGITGYDIYYRTNDGPWTLWLANTPLNCDTFHGLNDVTYSFYSVARDGAGHAELPPSEPDATTRTLPNYPPLIEPVPTQYVVVGQPLVITNRAYDPDQPVAFTLGANTPSGATITPNGVFKWTPLCAQGSTTNPITVWATDSGGPPMSSSMTFTSIVYECIEASLGNTVMQTGTTSSVPIYLLSTVELTNLSFTVVYPPERFTNLMVLADTNIVSVPFTTNPTEQQFLVSFALLENQVLYGPTNVGALSLEALAGQSSAFVPLEITKVTGLKPDGGLVGSWFGHPGRAVVLGEAPLLEALIASNGQPALILYAPPGSSNTLEFAPGLVPVTTWTPGQAVVVPTNALLQVVQPVVITNNAVFIRAVGQ